MKCKLCGSMAEPRQLYRALVECAECGLVYFPEDVNTKQLYGAEYFHGEEYHNYLADRAILQRNFRDRVQYLKRLKTGGRLFEIGCAYGFFLDLAKDYYQAEGIDISEAAADHAKKTFGLKVQSGDFLALPDPGPVFDFICLWDTIEHLSEPFAYLKKASDWLKPGGQLILSTGDMGSVLAKWRKGKWRQIHPPTHLFYFSEKTITLALQKAGLEIQEHQYIGQYRSYRSMLYEIFCLRNPKLSWIYGLLSFGGKWDFPVYLNTFDIMQVRAVKKS